MLAKVYSSALLGIEGIPVTVEVDVANGLPSFTTVGLPDGSVRESKDRVKAAIKNSGYQFPPKRVTVNLAPADLKKGGTAFDLPIAIGLLIASEIIPQQNVNSYLIVGELSLDGSINPVPGVLSIAIKGADKGFDGIIVPRENAREASLAQGIRVITATHLTELVEGFSGIGELETYDARDISADTINYPVGFEDVRGQESAKRALEIAAAGSHNILLKGVPGTGKTMLARSVPSILPDLSFEETVETTRIYSVISDQTQKTGGLMGQRPFRSPHHSSSEGGLIGGGTLPRPGEVSLAHNGVLFLDELPEFKKNILELLRQPLEDGAITISRVQKSITYPAHFMLIAAMNPCPCGYHGSTIKECHCNELQIRRYQNRISGPLLDRIDMLISVGEVSFVELHEKHENETSIAIKERVNKARKIQENRFAEHRNVRANGQMSNKDIDIFCAVGPGCQRLLEDGIRQLGLSARAYHRILKLSRTIADMEQCDGIMSHHVAEAISYRRGNLDSL